MNCRCGHDRRRHPVDGACDVRLPAFEEEELPSWACPCTRYATPLPIFDRYALCTGDCTTDCGACKGAGRPLEQAPA